MEENKLIKKYTNWESMCMCDKLTEYFIKKYKDKVS